MIENEMAALRQRAFREGRDQQTLRMVVIGEMTADEVSERAWTHERAQKLKGILQGALQIYRPLPGRSGWTKLS